MGLPKLKTKISVEDYLEGEKFSPVRREYIEGEVYAMAGASDAHNLIAGDLYIALGIHLRGSRCQPFNSDIKVQVTQNVYYYSDVLVSCKENPDNPYFRNAPILIIEVTSPSTTNIDRREKLLFYQQMPGVQEYAVVDRHRMNVELHRRQPNGAGLPIFTTRRTTKSNSNPSS
jgi:Uma2 family endonuclease